MHNQYCPLLKTYIFRFTRDKETAKDIASETMVVLWVNRESLIDGFAIKAFLFTVARRLCFKYLNKQERYIKTVRAYTQQDPFSYYTITEQTIISDIYCLLEDLIRELPPQQRAIIEIVYKHDLTLREIMEILNTSLANVKSQKHKALNKLKQQMAFLLESQETWDIVANIVMLGVSLICYLMR
ncbi:MAG: sigma-70 family RNA polymerase sigma factor [Chitinophagaceae bacterium]